MESEIKNRTILEVRNVYKTYESRQEKSIVLCDFNVQVAQSEFVSIIGHSGCGKSTVLSAIAGLTDIDSGHIILDGEQILGAGKDRSVVFQNPNLLPWMSALENVLLGVNEIPDNLNKVQKREKGLFFLNKVGLQNDANKKPSTLSQGMKQRVGIARAFATTPKLLLLDEPFGMLDSISRIELQEVLINIWNEEKTATILITHDIDEALLLSDKIILMTKGPSATVGRTLNIQLPRPRNRDELIVSIEYQKLREIIYSFLDSQ